jgi:putative molybdopterin biosynthesis protein
VKRARPPLPEGDLAAPDAILTTTDAARLLRVHPKHVYRLLRLGLPGHRVGGEWRFFAEEVLRWSGARTASSRGKADVVEPAGARGTPPLLAANGDIAVERLLARLKGGEGGPLGFVQADRGEGLELLRRGEVLAAGCHGDEIPTAIDERRLAFIHLVDRQVGLALRRGLRVRTWRRLDRMRVASRPGSAGVRGHFDGELRRQGVNPDAIHAKAALFPSHREVVCAVARGEMDVGLATIAWAHHVGLECIPICRETYGIVVRAEHLGDPRIVRLCEVAQSAAFRREVGSIAGYQARLAGVISYQSTRPRAGATTPATKER